MTPDLDLREIDQELLHDRLDELEHDADFGEEYDVLCWAREMLYLEAEGFIAIDCDGRYYKLGDCPDSPEDLHG